MKPVDHAHGSKQVDIKHALNFCDICIDGCHCVGDASAVDEDVQSATCQLLHRCLQLGHGLVGSDIKRKTSDVGVDQVTAILIWEDCRNGMNALAGIFLY